MKKTLRLLALVCALVMGLALCACDTVENGETVGTELGKSPNASIGTADEDRDAIAIRIGEGDDYTVKKGDLIDAYNSQLQTYAQYGMPTPTDEAEINSLIDYAAEALAGTQIILYQAAEMGIELEKADQDAIDADLEDEINYYLDNFKAQAESEGAEDIDARAEEIFCEELQNAGLDLDVAGYRAYVREFYVQSALMTKVEEAVKATVTVSEDDAKAYYEELVEVQSGEYAEAVDKYLDDQESYEKFGGDPIVVVPEGFVRVRTITVSPAEELDASYTTLKSEMTALEAEFGKLSLQDAKAGAARLAEIKTEYAAKRTEADAAYEAYISGARGKAELALTALKEGNAFTDVLEMFGEDDVYTTYPSFVSTGLLMQKGVASSTWPQALVDAVAALKPGEYSGIIQVDDMFYIVELVGDELAGTVAYEDVEEDIRAAAAALAAEDAWAAQQQAWRDDKSTVHFYEDVYRGIGK